ncbi:RNA polymerase sigma-28 factor precursor [compost metagenome]
MLYLVDKWIRRGSTEERDDLIGLGMYALVKAYEAYDINRNIKFSTLVGHVVWQELMAQVRRKEMVCRSKYSTVSINQPLGKGGEDDDKTYEEIVAGEFLEFEEVENQIHIEQIETIIESGLLSKAERIVSRKFFLENMELCEIANELGISRQAVQQSHKRSVKKLAEVVGF